MATNVKITPQIKIWSAERDIVKHIYQIASRGFFSLKNEEQTQTIKPQPNYKKFYHSEEASGGVTSYEATYRIWNDLTHSDTPKPLWIQMRGLDPRWPRYSG